MALVDERGLEIPFGPVGIGAMAIVGGIAFTLGQFAFYGFEFLRYLHLMGGWMLGLAVFAAASGTIIECVAWNGRLGRGARFLKSLRPAERAVVAAGILGALALAGGLARSQYQCLLFNAPPLFLIVFALATGLQQPILFALRDAGRAGAAFAVLLLLEAGILFGIGEWMAVGHYAKGLAHFQTEKRAGWSISTTDRTDFYIDYARQEVVLVSRTLAGDPLDVRRSLADFVCK